MIRFNYVCTDCGKEYEISKTRMLCDDCQKGQSPDKPLAGILEVALHGELEHELDIYDLLPVKESSYPDIPVGNTPIWEVPNIREKLDFKNLYIKDDTCNPTSSFKDRASYLVAAFAREHGIDEITLASTGNAGSSMAGIGAAAGLKVNLFLPKTAPRAKIVQAQQYGANVILVDGNYDKAYDLSMEYVKKKGSLSRNTGHNPLTIEGKKTSALEIVRDLGFAPDYVFVPTGDGVILSGTYKGFIDLYNLGVIEKIPTIVAVQSEKSNAIHLAHQSGEFKPIKATTIADSISVDIPRCGALALKNLKLYNGKTLEVSDEKIIQAQHELAKTAGLFVEPAAAASYAGFLEVIDELDEDDTVVLMCTGNGLKDIETALKGVDELPKPINDIDSIR